MEKKNETSENGSSKKPTYEIIAEWKRSKQENEQEFLKEINDPEHQKRIEHLRGKIVKNESASA